jgi:hypothetical protein
VLGDGSSSVLSEAAAAAGAGPSAAGPLLHRSAAAGATGQAGSLAGWQEAGPRSTAAAALAAGTAGGSSVPHLPSAPGQSLPRRLATPVPAADQEQMRAIQHQVGSTTQRRQLCRNIRAGLWLLP